ncbi:MAG: hypothetical protein AB7I38_02255 [Dehalococcoidia bacterium]
MNVILDLDEVHAVLARVSGRVIDEAGLSEAACDAIRAWRIDHDHGTQALDEFVVGFNEAVGNRIDERTSRRLRLRGGVVVSLKDTVKR